MNVPDRITELLKRPDLTGIDFIYVHPDQVTLRVFFLWDPGRHDPPVTPVPPLPLAGALTPADVRIYSPSGITPDIPVAQLDWIVVEGRDVLRLQTAFPGDFSLYQLRINDPRLDPFYNDVTFDFKANCPSDLDCAPPPPECPPDEWVDFPVDYQARDFWSLRQALLDFAGQRYPDWPDRLEADAGVMLAEVMSALGDEMAYYQDRIGREAYLETATQRRSLRRHARLIDYHLHDGLGAAAWLDVTVAENDSGDIPAGTDVWAIGESETKVDFEVGQGLADLFAEKMSDEEAPYNEFQAKNYAVAAERNEFQPHIWEEDQLCLPVGATGMYIKEHRAGYFEPDDQIEGLPGQVPGKWALLKTVPDNPAQSARAHMVRVIKTVETRDPVLDADITHLIWEEEQALPFELDMTVLTVRGNMIPATAGKTFATYFIIGANAAELPPDAGEALRQVNDLQPVARAVERAGRDNHLSYLFTLPGTEQLSLVWRGNDPHQARPEVVLQEMYFDGVEWRIKNTEWEWTRSFLGVYSSQSQDTHFTLEDGSWRRVVGYRRAGEEFIHKDYAANEGVTIRFGDGEFGRIPPEKTVFRVVYRLGGTRRSNVAADTLILKDDFPAFVTAVSNPLPASGGLDAETPEELRRLAPDAFRAVTYRAVRPEDYAEAAERLPWVQRAGASFRWTGSWLSAFVTPDPRNAFTLEEVKRTTLVRHLDRFRQAGREAHVRNPLYADLDIEIDICASPDAYPGEIKARVMTVLLGKSGIRSKVGYFSADHFTFGTPLDRTTLEAAIQATPGVRAVENIRFRRRGWFDWRTFTDFSYDPGTEAIIRVANDPLHPEQGTLKLYINGGA